MIEGYRDVITVLGEDIPLGASKEINFNIAKLHTATKIEVPVIIERSKKPGPTILFSAGLHGDEINGVDIVRQLISRGLNKPKRGTIICMPILNVFGFLNSSREFPDGRDLNRVFPGSKGGSLASRVAYKLMNDIITDVDLVIDFHTGGASRFNAAQIRIVNDAPELRDLANIFSPPFVLYSKNISKSFRNACFQKNKLILLYEGGKSFFVDNTISKIGVEGVKRVLTHFNMLNSKFKVTPAKISPIYVEKSKWIRANASGMFKSRIAINSKVLVGDILGQITDPYGKIHHDVKCKFEGYIINVNEASLVYQGDALFHIATEFQD